MKRKKIMQAGVLIAAMFITVTSAQAASDFMERGREGSAVNNRVVTENADVISNYLEGYIEVTGHAASPKTDSIAQMEVLAMEGARAMALGKLVQAMKKVHVTGQVEVTGGITLAQALETELDAVIDGNKIIGKEWTTRKSDGSIMGHAQVGYWLNGRKGLTETIIQTPAFKEAVKREEQASFKPQTPAPAPSQAYTGLIIDAGDLELNPGLFPTILAAGDNRVVYGASVANDPEVLVNGLVRYARTVVQAKGVQGKDGGPLVGDAPLLVKGTAIRGNISVAVSNDDAAKIYAADLKNGFLKQGKVVFVVN